MNFKPRKNAAVSAGNSKQDDVLRASETTEALVYEFKDGFTIKNCNESRFNACLEKLKGMDAAVKKETQEDICGKGQNIYVVETKNGERLRFIFTPKTKTLVCQGKRGELYINAQATLSEPSEQKSETYAAPDNTKVRASDVKSSLAKRIPSAMEYISAEAEVYLGYTLLSMSDAKLFLPEYSGEITRAGKGLEAFIKTLLASQAIVVNAVGQAFEKDDLDRYTLKGGYAKRIKKFTVYNEVLSALYTEYAVRNYYSHSDNIGGAGDLRIVTEKSEAVKIFNNLLAVIEYNCKKLKEIDFKLK